MTRRMTTQIMVVERCLKRYIARDLYQLLEAGPLKA